VPLKRRRWWIAVAVLAALAVAAAAVAARSRFSLSLDAAAPWVERRLASAVDPLRVSRGALGLRWGGYAAPVTLRAEGWGLLRADGEPFLDLPSVEVAFAQRGLLRGDLRPIWAVAAQPRLRLDRDQRGAFQPSLDELGGGERSGGETSGVSAVLDGWLATPPAGPLGRLQWARIDDASIVVRDRGLDVEWRADRLRIELSRRHAESLAMTGALHAGNAATDVELPFTGGYHLRERRLGVDLELPALEARRIAPLHPSLARLADLDLRLLGKARVSVAEELVADPIELTVEGNDGEAGDVDPIAVRASARWPMGSDSFSLRAMAEDFDLAPLAPLSPGLAGAAPLLPRLAVELQLDSADGRTAVLATLRAPPGEAEGAFSSVIARLDLEPAPRPADVVVEIQGLRPWRLSSLDPSLAPLRGVELPLDGALRGTLSRDAIALGLELHAQGGRLQVSGVPAEPLAVDTIEIRGQVAGPAAAPRLERGEVELHAGGISAQGEARWEASAYAATVRVDAAELDRRDLDRFWPSDLAPQTRARAESAWVVGALRDVSLAGGITVDPGARAAARLETLTGSATLFGLELDVLAPQPPVRVEGRATLDLDSLTAEVERGSLGGVEVGPATLRLAGWRGDHPSIAVDGRWRGALESAVALVASEPLSLIDGERLTGLAGSTSGELHLVSDAGESAEGRRVAARANGVIENLVWENGPFGLPVSRGRVSFSYDADEFSADGEADLSSSPTRFSLRHRLDEAEPRDVIRITADLAAETAHRLEVPQRFLVGGTIGVGASYTGRHDGAVEVLADLDLTPARLEVAEAGVVKPAGETASARIDAALDGSGALRVRSLTFAGRELEGAARLDATLDPFQLQSATVDRLTIGATELNGALRRRPDGGWSAAVEAARLDLRPFLDSEETLDSEGAAATTTDRRRAGPEAAPAGSSPQPVPFDFEVEAESLLLLREIETGRFAAGGAWNGERWDRLSVAGDFDAATRLAFDYDHAASAGAIDLQASDLGGLMQALVSRSEISGGALHLTGARSPGDDRVVGHVALRSFTVLEMPVFASILKLGTLDNLVGLFESKGLRFERADADLAWDGRRLEVSKGRAVGRGIALTGAGSFDLAAGTLDLTGTVAPMRVAQRIVAKIPVVNTLVLGRDRAGVVATRFRLTGAIAQPEIRVEPLSTFTPGFLRDLFGGHRGGGEKGRSPD
jgi:hypothetical protein